MVVLDAVLVLPGPPRAAEAVIDPTVRAAQAGDDRAFAALYDAHAGRVHALCLRLSADPAHAADLVQDVFVRVWERLGGYRGESAFTTWLHRVAVNTAFEEARTTKRRRLRVAIAADFADLEIMDRATAPAAQVAHAIDLDDAIRRLPAGARAVFVLHDIEGYQHGEIATLLGIAEGTSKAHLFRARRLLRGLLDR